MTSIPVCSTPRQPWGPAHQDSIAHNGTHASSDHHVVDPHAWRQAQSTAWQHHEPPFLHSLKWRDAELGVEHMTVIRASTIDDLWLQVRTVMALIKASKTKGQARETQARSASHV